MLPAKDAWIGHTAWRAGVCVVAVVVTCATAAAQQPQPDRASKTAPDRATWVRLDCLTTGCHAKLSAKKVVHAPVLQGACDVCHEVADAAKHTFEPVADGSETCLDCHDTMSDALDDTETYVSQHAPVTEGACLDCHDPHQSKLASLLTASYRLRRYARFDEAQFELCFQCHDAELVTERDTDEATEFRNGELNLHNVHVGSDGKGRNCKTCHRPHVSKQARLIRKGIAFRKWKMPLRYLPTKTGGYCGPACHAARSYDREQAVSRGFPAKPPK